VPGPASGRTDARVAWTASDPSGRGNGVGNGPRRTHLGRLVRLLAVGTLVSGSSRLAAASPRRVNASPIGPSPTAVVTLKRQTFRTSDRVSLSWLSGGTASRLDPIVFLPGWSMPAELFVPQLQALGRSRSVRALDPRGQGESESPAGGYDATRRARDLFEFFASMRRPPIVVAWSLAGIEMLHGLRQFGDGRIRALVLVDSSLGEGPAGSGEVIAAFRAQLQADRRGTLEGFARAIFRSPRSDEQIASLVDAMQAVPLQPSLDMLDYGLPRPALRDAARQFRKPLMLAYTPQYRSQVALHREARPDTRVELFEEAGHALFADEPDRFNRLIDAFSRNLPSPRTARRPA